jgi:pilus assembly protein CpaB
VLAGLFGYAGLRSSVEAQAALEQVVVIQTTRVVTAGARLSEGDFEKRSIPAGALQGNEVTALADAVGRFAVMPMVKGEILLKDKVAEQNPASELALRVPSELVALPLTLNDPITQGKLLAPGDRVDVLGLVTKETSASAEVVVSNVLVLAVGDMLLGDLPAAVDPKAAARTPRAGDATVVVAVTTEQGLRLLRFTEIGRIRLVVRGSSR